MRCRVLARALIGLVLLGTALSGDVYGQSRLSRGEVAAQVTDNGSGELRGHDVGLGVRAAWHPIASAGIEAEVTLYPDDFPGGRAFSRRRVEVLAGVTAGPRLGSVRVVGRVRPGLLRVSPASGPFPCILIYPPPLACVLASGRTLPVVELGGGVEVPAASAAFFRIDLGDRLIRYPGPALDHTRTPRTRAFVAHGLRLAVGAGWRF